MNKEDKELSGATIQVGAFVTGAALFIADRIMGHVHPPVADLWYGILGGTVVLGKKIGDFIGIFNKK